jgi:hypothetical protein
MATYKQIIADVLEHDKLYVQTPWIAHVKELNGLTFRPSHNRRFADRHLHPCPDHVRPLIEASLRRFKMI